MTKILGLDLGTNSIGWALVDETNEKILGIGSRIFPMGINLEKGTKEVSKNQTRREKRQIRRQGFRRRMRKEKLVEQLIPKGMFPDIHHLYHEMSQNGQDTLFRDKFQAVVRQVVLPDVMKSFFQIDPYWARAKAFRGEQLTKLELGRVLYQFAQRRGYKESLKSTDEGKIFDGDPKDGKIGIDETKEKIEEHGTLGNYLFHENPHQTRLRNRYTLRSMYTSEFDHIWKKQSYFYPEILTDRFRAEIGGHEQELDGKNGVLFFQRPLRSQKHLIGKCTFEEGKTKAQLSSIPFELFRTWQTINNIKDGEEQLSEKDRHIAFDFFCSKDRAFDFLSLKKKLSNKEGNYNYSDKDKLPGNRSIANFRKVFTKKVWDSKSLEAQEEIWHIKLSAEDPKWLKEYAASKWDLDEADIEKLKKFNLIDSYANLSRKAIINILPYLEQGYVYDEAVLLGGLRSAFTSKTWDELSQEKRNEIEDNVLGIAKDGSEGKAIDRIKPFLKKQYGLSDRQLKDLYHHSVGKETDSSNQQLAEPENVRNPLVQQAMFEIRNVVNLIIQEYGKPGEIRVELARELKGSKEERDRIRKGQQERETKNDDIKLRLDEYGLKHTRANIQKVQLWRECNMKCPFTGRPISREQLFDDGYVQVEHIIPYSISLNDSLQNKTLCLADKNREKGNRTPFQAFGHTEEWEKMKQRAYVLFKGNYNKYQRFISEENPDANDFLSSQLNDTRYISKLTKEYLKQVCPKVTVAQGMVTSLLRHYWGMDGILGGSYEAENHEDGEYYAAIGEQGEVLELVPWNYKTKKADKERLAKKGELLNGNVKDKTFYPKKNREDHRHHAIDALTVALSKQGYLQKISTLKGKGMSDRVIRREKAMPRPWENFNAHARLAVNNILVSHKQNDRTVANVKKKLYEVTGEPKLNPNTGKPLYSDGMAARGSLHAETVYGKHKHPDGEYYHIRKPIDFIDTHKHVEKIVDPMIRGLVRDRLTSLGINVDNPKGYKLSELPAAVKKEVFFKTLEDGTRIPQIYLPNKNGSPIPVKKVRIKETLSNAEELKEGVNQWVNPKNNHHVLIYRKKDGTLEQEVVSFWTAVERAKQGQSVYQLPDDGEHIVATLKENDLFLVGLPEDWEVADTEKAKLGEYLYRVQKISSMYYNFRKHTASSLSNPNDENRIQSMKAWESLNPLAVKISVLGDISLR